MNVSFLKFQNALETVHMFLYGNNDESCKAYRVQCMYRNNSAPRVKAKARALQWNIDSATEEYNQCLYTDGDGNETYLEELYINIATQVTRLATYKHTHGLT